MSYNFVTKGALVFFLFLIATFSFATAGMQYSATVSQTVTQPLAKRNIYVFFVQFLDAKNETSPGQTLEKLDMINSYFGNVTSGGWQFNWALFYPSMGKPWYTASETYAQAGVEDSNALLAIQNVINYAWNSGVKFPNVSSSCCSYFNSTNIAVIFHAGNDSALTGKSGYDMLSITSGPLYLTPQISFDVTFVAENDPIGVIMYEITHQLEWFTETGKVFGQIGEGFPDPGGGVSLPGTALTVPWGLMFGGAYNGDPRGTHPAEYGAFERMVLGFPINVSVVSPTQSVRVRLQDLEEPTNGYQAIRIPIKTVTTGTCPSCNINDYFYIVELRKGVGSDYYFPWDTMRFPNRMGMLIWYFDYSENGGGVYGYLMKAHSYDLDGITAMFGPELLPGATNMTMYDSTNNLTITILSTASSSFLVGINETPLRSTSTTLSCPASSSIDVALSCNAMVADTSPGAASTPAGTVTFTPGGTCTLVSGVCSVTITPSIAGTLSVTAVYNPTDSVHAESSGSESISVGFRSTSTTVSCSPNSGTVGLVSICTTTVADTSLGTASTPTGMITWTHTNTGTLSSTTCTLASGSCTVDYTANAQGSHVVTVSYDGDSTHAISSNSVTIAIAIDNTSVAIICTPATVALNQPSSCNATVNDNTAPSNIPTGTVTLTSSGPGTFTGTCTLDASGSCTIPVSYSPTALGSGTHTITGAYTGDPSHATSIGNFALSVALRSTSTTMFCPSSGSVGVSLTCYAIVADTAGGAASSVTGTVTFVPGSICTLVSGSCSASISPSSVGILNVSASYNPSDSVHATSSGSDSISVTNASVQVDMTSTAVTCVPSTVIVNQPTSCTASVIDGTTPSSTPTGTVTFSDSGAFTRTCILNGSGSCTTAVSYTPAAIGTYVITGTYSGDSAHGPSQNTSSLTSQPNNLPPPNQPTNGPQVLLCPSISCFLGFLDLGSLGLVINAGLVLGTGSALAIAATRRRHAKYGHPMLESS